MPSRLRTILVFSMLAVISIFAGFRIVSWQEKKAHQALADELKLVISSTMLDLSQAKSSSMASLPPDGQWRQSVSFVIPPNQAIRYSLQNKRLFRHEVGGSKILANHVELFNLRRMPSDPRLIDVQVNVKNGVLLNSSIKIRLRE